MITALTRRAIIFFFNDTATTEIYTLSLHDALPICCGRYRRGRHRRGHLHGRRHPAHGRHPDRGRPDQDRKSTRLNSSHSQISYAVFCLKKKKKKKESVKLVEDSIHSYIQFYACDTD